MTLQPHARLLYAVMASAAVHTALLYPVKAPTTTAIATPIPQTRLTARLNLQAAPLAQILPDAPMTSPLARPMPAPVPLERNLDTAKSDTPAAALREIPTADARTTVKPNPPPPQSSGEQPGQTRPGVRAALPDEVKIRVRLYDKSAPEDSPNEVLQTESGRYIYFNAPQLKETARPLADSKPYYPRDTLGYPHGAVSLLLLIDEQGKLEKATVLCANPAFEASALASIQDMRFGTARDANGPVKSYMLVDFGYGVGAPCGPLPATIQMQLGQSPR